MPSTISKYHGVYETSSEDSRNLVTESHVSGAKLWLLFMCLIFLGLLCLSNLLILAVMYEVLDIGMDGMGAISFIKPQQHTQWVLDTDLETIVLTDGMMSGFVDQNLNLIGGHHENVTLSASLLSQSTMSLTPSGTVMKTNNFKFVNPVTKKSILDFDENNKLSVVGEFGGKSIITDGVKTPRIVSPLDKDLNINSPNGKIYFTGNEGIEMDGKAFDVSATGDISFNVQNNVNNLVVDGLFKLNSLRIPNSNGQSAQVTNVTRFRLCVCTRTGVLFRVQIPNEPPFPTCAIAMENPCSD